MIRGKEAKEIIDSHGIKRFDCARCRAKFRPNQKATIKDGKLYCIHHLIEGDDIETPDRSR